MIPEKINLLIDRLIGDFKLDSYLKTLLRIEEGTSASTIFDFTYDVLEGSVPYISNTLQSRRIRSLEKGLKQMNEVFQNMNVVLKEHEEKFIQEKALPLIFKNIIQEDQEEKIRIMINGFETIIYDSIYGEDDLYEYYDVLKSLRYKEVARMIQLYNRDVQNQETYNIGNIDFDGTSKEYIDNKLVQLGLREVYVLNPGTYAAIYSPKVDTRITEFGERFIKFFRNRKIDE